MTAIHTLRVPGAHLHYEVRGTGPLLLLMGSPMEAAAFASLADALAADHTVVTHDPRGISGSALDDPEEDTTVDRRADDVAAILDALGADSADVFGSSGGAVTGLALVTRHPGRVRTLVAHEPPVMEILPDAAEHRAMTEDIIGTHRREGQGAAWVKFMTGAGFDDEGCEEAPVGPHGEPSAQDVANGDRFFGHDLRATAGYVPDVPALAAAPTRVVVGIGVASEGLITYRTSVALAELLGTRPAGFPGDHAGFLEDPNGFAEALRKTLAG
ncbi:MULTISPECIES: alpha/beta fold hydrolase [unclassified Streptomyces]|uniref:alpha/beta fold hydrolase n=1 Tax=unclassified Streptomyces TaxID=2593676 RepID=UPI0011E7898A|nr:alpha/beta hydrolase [Streptomyces sp. sk2.1]TXS58022.1 alpha/beta hydrolase [Streptomyces sp. sk2.1]